MGIDSKKNKYNGKKRSNKSSAKTELKDSMVLLPRLNGFDPDNKDFNDGLAWSSTAKKHRKTASSSSYMFMDMKKKSTPPWDHGRSASYPPLRCEIKNYLIKFKNETSQKDCILHNYCLDIVEAEECLLHAAERGHLDVIRFFLTPGPNLRQEGHEMLCRAIFISAYCNEGSQMVALVKKANISQYIYDIPFNGIEVTLLHLVAHLGLLNSTKTLVETPEFKLKPNVADADKWTPLHYAASQGHVEVVRYLLEEQCDPNSEGPYKVTPLHVAAYVEEPDVGRVLVDFGADTTKYVTLNHPFHSDDSSTLEELPKVVQYNSKLYCTPLHWAVHSGDVGLVEKTLEKGANVNISDLEGRTPLGLALLEGQTEIVKCFAKHGIHMSDEDKNWKRVLSEECGRKIVQILEDSKIENYNCCSKEGFTLAHLAASRGYLGLLGDLLSKGVDPDLENSRGDTPLFCAVEANHQACVQLLVRHNCNIAHLNKRGCSVLHIASKCNNFAAIDMVLQRILRRQNLDINLPDQDGFTAIYYAINSSRFDIVQRFVQYCVTQSIHVKATQDESLLQFYTERNMMGQYDNAIVRVLELEKALHTSKLAAEKCLRSQLGTTEGSTKARDQLDSMYESTVLQQHCWNFWIVLTCLLMPFFLYYLDVYTDVILAFEYYNDYHEVTANRTGVIESRPIEALFQNLTESQSKINFMLTVFFILSPMLLMSIWSCYVHITQPDILPFMRRFSNVKRSIFYIVLFVLPIGPIMTYVENMYAQICYVNVTSDITKHKKTGTMSVLSLAEGDTVIQTKKLNAVLRKQYNLKHNAQMRVAINNVLEATLESAFQLVLQLYIVGTQYNDLKQLHLGDMTIGSILSLTPTQDSQGRLAKQVLSVFISLVSLTWSFTAYHRFSKLGGLRILWSLPLMFAIFFQIVSRAIACTVFTLAYTWRIFIVLGVHFVLVLIVKMLFEKRSPLVTLPLFDKTRLMSGIRPYFYVLLGSFTSTFVYFRIERPLGDKETLMRRDSTFVTQILFLVLALIENVSLLSVGVPALDEDFDDTFKIVACVICLISFMIGVILQWVYYGCFGHPWVNINGPSYERTEDNNLLLTFYLQNGESRWLLESCCNCSKYYEEEPPAIAIEGEPLKVNGVNSHL